MKYGRKSGKSAAPRGRATPTECRGAQGQSVGVMSGVVQGPVNSPEAGARKTGDKKTAFAKPGAKSTEKIANRA